MILPTKHLPEHRSLLAVGARILLALDTPGTVSQVWETLRADEGVGTAPSCLSYDWFVLALDCLYAMGLVEMHDGTLRRQPR
ncbi:hypothetical protein LLH03_14785 [bacterium]|nr:hypothetical protein [bacterium]